LKQGTQRYTSIARATSRLSFRNISYTYPGSREPAVKSISFTLNAGETLAIVGYNGSGSLHYLGSDIPCIIAADIAPGKSTLANILLRIADFDGGELIVNGQDIRKYDPGDLHKRITAVFQGFSKFDASMRENVGIGFYPDMRSPKVIGAAMNLAGADHIASALPHGLKTRLDPSGPTPVQYVSPSQSLSGWARARPHGLSGGEVQHFFLSLSCPQDSYYSF
jgi:ABC-type multidrug transport system fused ATPase/permease subunit